MKTKHRIVGVLMILAVMASLFAVMAAPAGAVTAATVTVTPPTVGSAAQYQIAFNTVNAIAIGDAINIEFPSGTSVPTSIDYRNITVNGTVLGAAGVAVNALTVTISSPVAVNAATATTVVISQVAGIKNPTSSGTTKKLTVATTSDPVAVNSSNYIIRPTYSISSTSKDRNSTVTVTGAGWTANSGIVISNGLTGTGTADSSGNFTVTATPNATGAVYCKDGSGKGSPNSGAGTLWTGMPEPTFTLKPRITVSPESANVGATISIKGYDYTSTSNIPINGITLGGVNWGPTGAYTLTTRDAYGTLDDFSISLMIPLTATAGANTVSGTDAGAANQTTVLTVNKPTITLTPSEGGPNTTVTVTGSNFAVADTFAANSITFAGAAWNTTSTATIDGSGSFTMSLKVPATAVSGGNPVVATSTGGTVARETFTVSSRALTLSPTSGPRGSRVTVGGANMTAGATIAVGSVTFAGAAWNTTAITVDSLGNVSPTTLTVPSTAGTGNNTVSASDGTVSATKTFTVTQPSLAISASTGYRGDNLTVTGSGWVPGALGIVQLQLAGITRVTSVPDSAGNITAVLPIPLNATTSSLIAGVDSYGNTSPSLTFTLKDAVLSLSPQTGPIGTKVTVTGVGFAPQSGVSMLTVGAGNVLPTSPVITDTIGTFSASFTVPGLSDGAQTVSATVGGVTATTFFTVEAAAPTVSTALSTVAGKYTKVWTFDAATQSWRLYDTAAPEVSDLEGLTRGQGYWLEATADATILYGGNTYSLRKGWNLIGWLG